MRFIPFCLLAFCLVACGAKKEQAAQETAPEDVIVQEVQENQTELLVTDDVERDDEEIVNQEMPCQSIEANFQPEPETQAVSILGHYRDGSCLIIKYQHSGCSEGNLVLADRGQEDGSHQLELYVKDAGPCEMLIQGTALFSIPEGMTYQLNDGRKE